MTDPALVAQLDQAQAASRAAYGVIADQLVIAWQELQKRGVPTEHALDIASDWIGMTCQTALAKWADNG